MCDLLDRVFDLLERMYRPEMSDGHEMLQSLYLKVTRGMDVQRTSRAGLHEVTSVSRTSIECRVVRYKVVRVIRLSEYEMDRLKR